MLRSSVSKAFGAAEGQVFAERDPAGLRRRSEAIRQLFHDLHDAFGRRVRELERAGGDGASGPTPLEGPLRVGKERSLLDGIEFVLETPRESWRFVDTLDGALRVDRVEAAGLRSVEWIGVARAPGGWTPIRKPIVASSPALASASRVAFRRTSVPALVVEFLAAGGVESASTGESLEPSDSAGERPRLS